MLYSIHQLKKNNLIKNFLLIDYNDLVSNPKKTIDKIYSYYGIEKYKHTFDNLKQPFYNDSILGAPMHRIRTDKIKKSIDTITLPQTVINKYQHLNRIWNE